MDTALHTSIIIFLTITLRHVLIARWERFKERKALEPITLKLRKGVYVPWGPVQRMESIFRKAVVVWCLYMAALLAALFWVKVIA